MKISKLKGSNKRSGLCRLGFEGDMTIYHAQDMLEVMMPHTEDYKQFELNLSKVEDVDSAGIQLLLMLDLKSREKHGETSIVEPSGSVYEVLNLYRLVERFNVQPLSQ